MSGIHAPERLDAFQRSGLSERCRDKRLQSLAMAARQLLFATAAMVNVHDEYERHIGMDPDVELPLQLTKDSGCRVVIEEERPIRVRDTQLHPVMCSMPWVGSYRAYLGVPIWFEDQVIGTVCVLDAMPREWTVWEETTLLGLAQLAGLSVTHES